MGEFHLSLKPFGVCEFNLATQWSSRSSNVFLPTVVLVHFVNASMIINRACLVKSCPGFWKCSSYRMDFVFFASFRWLYNLSFHGVSNFPIY